MAEVCAVCGLPKDLCVCRELEKQQARIVVRLEMRRFRKPTTLVEGIDAKRIDQEQLVKTMKRRLACGGSAKEGTLVLQGDQRQKAKEILVKEGFDGESIEVQ
ncbi:MAG: stress response translation initiation inhibitor YciH [Nitrososphaerota archaeon]|nr:stress response translation initiation inhibitor YciH [Nitrososphaerota archaeon]MDG6939723.1 stress response translation initiation inhibitor YciH [Nitrososphaerota archaeon]